MAEKTRKIIDAHGHLVQYIAGTGAGGELRFVGNGDGGICIRREVPYTSGAV